MRPNLMLGTGLTQESIWAIWSWGFATPDADTEAFGAHLLLLLPFSPPVGSGARSLIFLISTWFCLLSPHIVVLPPCLVPYLHAAGGQTQLRISVPRANPASVPRTCRRRAQAAAAPPAAPAVFAPLGPPSCSA